MNPNELSECIVAVRPAATAHDYTYTTDSSGYTKIALWNNAIGTQPTDAQLQAALDSITLKTAQQAQTALLMNTYNTKRFGQPAALNANGTTLTFPTDTITQTNLSGYLVAYADGSLPSGGVPLLDVNNAAQMLTFAQLQTLAKTIAQNSIDAFQTLQSKIAQVMAATTVTDVQAVVWS